MALETLSPTLYLSTAPPMAVGYAPGKPLTNERSYGGHAYAQSIWAASLTLQDSGFRIHEANGYWTQAGHANRPFIYEITTLSQTRSFVLRQVTARQPTTPSDECPFPRSDADKPRGPAAFVMTCSFKRAEEGPQYGLRFGKEKYGGIFAGGRDFEEFEKNATLPGPNGRITLADFPGLDVRTPNLEEYSKRNPGTGHRRLHVYRASMPMGEEVDVNLWAAAHAFVSDRAGLSVLVNAFGEKRLGMAGSLSHKMVFHVNSEELRIGNGKEWFIQEMSSPRGGEGRGTIETRIWSPSGQLIVSTMQDAMLRRPLEAKLS
ncbi:hypothetical protein FE257_004614 [Aspergillus nanangensis]|uniref:Thioesterase-like superfamily-domain-containing protein n=1 Tax=Aspergillus nanangensis TaxID=2582783 RepID=A0AAD4CYC5_ASPNN|nr:hypothetical protein FE257_004614 [Aspergillus nanangensis]